MLVDVESRTTIDPREFLVMSIPNPQFKKVAAWRTTVKPPVAAKPVRQPLNWIFLKLTCWFESWIPIPPPLII